jgi:hypothetical protein
MRKLLMGMFGVINAKNATEVAQKSEEKRKKNEIFVLLREIGEVSLKGGKYLTKDKISDKSRQLLEKRGFTITIPREDYIRVNW